MAGFKLEKENVKSKLEQGILKTCAKARLATASWWDTFLRIKDDKDNIIPFLQCTKCFSILSYEVDKTGSSTHRSHAQNCFGGGAASTLRNQDIGVMFRKDNGSLTVAKTAFAEACAKFCAYDLRSFETVNGRGFEVLCQSLLDVAHKHSHPIDAKSIISDPTTISRRVHKLVDERRLELVDTLLSDLKKIKLFGVTTDFWKNKYSSESYLTVTLGKRQLVELQLVERQLDVVNWSQRQLVATIISRIRNWSHEKIQLY
ncbi:unnamed protein product [Rotaria magnacalcarata]|uniref:BED-type domain-containing protein n=2 Tax=Rotaria magnacalcarata TaxID=392030 RepID=A0A816AHE2_9BILA|nr:unnamed protein product [Rotaria magnacalcarata]CAF1596230.1 unnamed protein product [Rotaria magnacalcarata]CAF2110587.1 unnamed protein product [Rotaria magnacalcarata]CAF3784532.1 unnamed protein product [Rotaria magnacalcarata]CAF4047484.1 unnamed protein product [Rotaria magnacalcarata]